MTRRAVVIGVGAVAAAVAAVAAVAGVLALRPPREAEAAVAPPAVPVVADTVAQHDVPIYLRGVGTAIAYNNVVARSQITGQLIKIAFTQGQAVKKGDLLAKIDPRPYQAQLDQVTANRDRDQAQLLNAQANLDRYTPLAEKGFATQQLLETQKAQLAQLQAAVKSDEALIENAKVNLGYTRITSPIDGVTGIRQIDDGNIIHPTDPNGLVDITQIQPISLIFTLPEQTLPAIQQQMANGALTVIADSQDGKYELDHGKLELVDNQIDQTTGTIRLRATFPNGKRTLWPGELVNVRLLLETEHDALTIPASAVQQGPNGAFVYVIGGDTTVAMRPVEVAAIDGGVARIAKGLTANETVVTDGQYRLAPGVRTMALHGADAKRGDLSSAVEEALP
jgi:multidrug efflux system membrane fusion protein